MEQIGRRSNHPYQGVLSHCFELTCKFYQFLNNFHCWPDTPNSLKSSSSPSQFDPNLISKYLNIQISNLVHFLKIPIQPLYILPLNPTLADSAFFLWKIARILATYFVTKVRKLFVCWQKCINSKSTSPALIVIMIISGLSYPMKSCWESGSAPDQCARICDRLTGGHLIWVVGAGDTCVTKNTICIDLLRQVGGGFSLFRQNAEFSQPLLGLWAPLRNHSCCFYTTFQTAKRAFGGR